MDFCKFSHMSRARLPRAAEHSSWHKGRFGSLAGYLALVPLGLLAFLGACTSVLDVKADTPLSAKSRWALLPFGDFGETPQAGERAEEIASSLMHVKWNVELERYPSSKETADLVDLDERQRYEKALAWARSEGMLYGLTGSVQEWRYRAGSEGEAAVGLTLRVVNIKTGRSEWLASGARSGFGAQTVSGLAERLIGQMLGQIRMQ